MTLPPSKASRAGKGGIREIISNKHCELDGGNPFTNHLILENLFKFCSFKTLNRCRLVDKFWYQISFPVWTKKAPQIILCTDPRKFQHDKSLLLPTFVEEILGKDDEDDYSHYEYLGIRQYRNFSLSNYKLGSGSKELVTFWNRCGQWITHLDLYSFHFLDLQLFRDVMLSKFTPNLEKLETLIDCDFETVGDLQVVQEAQFNLAATRNQQKKLKSLEVMFDDVRLGGRQLPMSWVELLGTYPNLESLSLGHTHGYWESEVRRMTNAILKLREEDKQQLNLKSLDIVNLFEDYGIPKLPSLLVNFFEKSQLSLESLALDVGKDLQPSVAHKVLNFHSKTLKKLTIYQDNPSEHFYFPELESLQELKLIGYPFSDLTFLKHFPTLKYLNLQTDMKLLDPLETLWECSEQEDANMPDGFEMPFLTTFLCDYEMDISADDLIRLKRWMPAVKHLGLELTNETFPVVCELWPDLETLCIVGDQVDDIGITGVPAGRSGGLQQRYQNITRLQALRTFSMRNCVGDDDLITRLTEKSVYHGFLHLPHLDTLEITVSEMEPQALKVLAGKVSNLRVTVHSESASEEDSENASDSERIHAEEDADYDRMAMNNLVPVDDDSSAEESTSSEYTSSESDLSLELSDHDSDSSENDIA